MLRVLFSVLAVVVAVLAIVLEQPLLYAVAAVLLLIVFILLVTRLRRQSEPAKPYTTPRAPLPEDELKALGIVEIKPKSKEAGSSRPASPEPEPAARKPSFSERSHWEEEEEEVAPLDDDFLPPTTPADPNSHQSVPVQSGKPHQPEAHESKHRVALAKQDRQHVEAPDLTALILLLRSVREATGAHTVGIFRQTDLAPDYNIIALVDNEGERTGFTFSAQIPLLSASMAQHPVTVYSVGERGVSMGSLGYSSRPGAIREVAVAPIPRNQDPEVYFLLADRHGESMSLEHSRTRALLANFAQLVGLLLQDKYAEVKAAASAARTTLPTRREIIAEEMMRARQQDTSLALALVHLNQAPAVADSGDAALAAAERLLKARLAEAAAPGRVERFGELTYGVFFHGPSPQIDAWGRRLQREFAGETGLLEGGVSVGIAVLQDRHQSPDAFRADATEALREAYESGTCTIVE